MEWISVKDRLPEYGENVLIARNNNYANSFKSVVFGYRKSTDENGDHWGIENCTTVYGYITHWMPLPEAPK